MADQPDSANPTDVTALSSGDTRDRFSKTKSHRIQSASTANPAQKKTPKGLKKAKDYFPMIRKKQRIADYVLLQSTHPDLTKRALAEKLGVSLATLERDLQYAHKEGWLNFDEPLEKLKYEVIPGAMANLAEFVKQKDRTVTLETMKATVFKQYQAELGIMDGGQNILALKIEMVGGPEGETKIVEGQIVGRAKQLEE